MQDELDREQELASRLNAYVSSSVRRRQPEQVVARVLARSAPRSGFRLPRLSVARAAVVLLLLVGVASIAFLGSQGALPAEQGGARAAKAFVGGVEYLPAPGRSFSVPSGLLEPYGTATRVEVNPGWLDGTTVYAIRGMDPARVLVMRFKPGARDDAGVPLGEFLLLVRGRGTWQSLCPYFDPASDAIPTVCR